MKILRYILFPIVPIYHLITWLRNRFYDIGLLSSKSYDLPIICVGNLSVGGTGKTPMIEYLIRLLKDDFRLATLSRGYGRETQGFVLADEYATAKTIGDEPFQFFTKFKDINVAVDANRQEGISNLLQLEKNPQVILLDDAFQHRKVKAGLNIMLTTYDNLYVNDVVLPTGNLREPRSGAKRADIIIVTKCPTSLGEVRKEQIIKKINPNKKQYVFFSTITYSKQIYNTSEHKSILSLKETKFTLVTGIANSKPLVDYLNSEGFNFEHLNYKDHYSFTENDINTLKKKELLLTTEKDFMRLSGALDDSRLWYLPIETEISNNADLNRLVKKYLTN